MEVITENVGVVLVYSITKCRYIEFLIIGCKIYVFLREYKGGGIKYSFNIIDP